MICKKCANANGKDGKYTNAIDISIIWLYWRLLCRLYCKLYCRLYWRLFCRLYCRLFFVTQYFFFPLFHKCSKFMTLSNASRIFLSYYCFFSLPLSFLFNTQNPRGYPFRIYRHAYFKFLKESLATSNSSSVNTSFSSWIVYLVLLDTIRIWPWPVFLNFLVWERKTVSATIGSAHDVYPRWLILTGTASSCRVLHQRWYHQW